MFYDESLYKIQLGLIQEERHNVEKFHDIFGNSCKFSGAVSHFLEVEQLFHIFFKKSPFLKLSTLISRGDRQSAELLFQFPSITLSWNLTIPYLLKLTPKFVLLNPIVLHLLPPFRNIWFFPCSVHCLATLWLVTHLASFSLFYLRFTKKGSFFLEGRN